MVGKKRWDVYSFGWGTMKNNRKRKGGAGKI